MCSTSLSSFEAHYSTSARSCLLFKKLFPNIWPRPSSDPVRVCFCNNSQPDCSYQPLPIQIKKGESFTVPLLAVDQVNTTVNNTTIHISTKGGLGEGQQIQQTSDGCTNLTFNMFSKHNYEDRVIYAEGPCKDAKLSKRTTDILFSPCTCPIGFQQRKQLEEFKCECSNIYKSLWSSKWNTNKRRQLLDYFHQLLYQWLPHTSLLSSELL